MVKCIICDYYSERCAALDFSQFFPKGLYQSFQKRHICGDCAVRYFRERRDRTTFDVCEERGRMFNAAEHRRLFNLRGKMFDYNVYCKDKVRCYACMVKWFRTDLDVEGAEPDILKAKVRKRRLSGSSIPSTPANMK